MPRIRKLIVSKILSDEEIASKEGTWFEEKDFSQWDERIQFYLHEFMTVAKGKANDQA